MGCVNTKISLKKYNGILTSNHLLYSNIKSDIKKFIDQQKINSYSLFFVNSKCCSPSRQFKFENNQILLVDLASYYSNQIIRVWSIKLLVNNLNIKFAVSNYNSMINKNRINKFSF